jgi:hypothetical protein
VNEELERAAVVVVPRLLSLSSAGDVLGCSARTVRRRIEAGLLRGVLEQGRLMVRGDDLRDYVDALESPQRSTQLRRRQRRGSPYARIVQDGRS